MAWCVSSPCPSKYTLAHTPRHCSAILVQHQQPAHLCRSCNKLESYHSHFEDEIRLTLKRGLKRRILRPSSTTLVCAETKANQRPLKLIISGAPASGKGTQCELIVKKYGLVHISTGDLLRSEVAAGSANGKKAKEFMEKGALVPDEIVVSMVKRRLAQQDAQEKGWLLDGYPRSLPQAQVFESLEIKPDIFLVLDVPDEILIERVVGRRLDPITGKIYHLKYLPPETEEIAARLTQRFDDTEEKARSRLQTHQQNIEAVLSVYKNIMKTVNGNHPKEEVFKEIDTILVKMLEGGPKDVGFPVGMNDVPTKDAVMDDRTFRSTVEINIPELNPNMDVYRIGTLMELVRVIALTFADDGKRVKVCVQGSMGEGVLAGMPLQLAGTRKILEFMDWGEYDAKGTFINIGSIGAKEVNDQDNMFILVAPQNAMGNCIIDDLQAMVEAAGSRPMILVNPRLKDLPSAGGIMQTIGREERMEFAASFLTCYSFRLLYKVGTQYPIVGALRMSYPYAYELYKRIDTEPGKEEYVRIATFTKNPTSEEINDTFSGKSRKKELESTGLWGFLSAIF
uniref:adenylate kinase n=1 Tax=Araucaria cunninghamii TaxID=56994 RepID=A0A0D6QX12_ARACU